MPIIKSDHILVGNNLTEFKGYLEIKNNIITGIKKSKPNSKDILDASDYILCP
ncbi:hypothetical protein HY570_01945, partial [Candidatus Micrarchaeota archaeon]|nr:hypothetical protein [Candidatus Micrarchaeota archaeon]